MDGHELGHGGGDPAGATWRIRASAWADFRSTIACQTWFKDWRVRTWMTEVRLAPLMGLAIGPNQSTKALLAVMIVR